MFLDLPTVFLFYIHLVTSFSLAYLSSLWHSSLLLLGNVACCRRVVSSGIVAVSRCREGHHARHRLRDSLQGMASSTRPSSIYLCCNSYRLLSASVSPVVPRKLAVGWCCSWQAVVAQRASGDHRPPMQQATPVAHEVLRRLGIRAHCLDGRRMVAVLCPCPSSKAASPKAEGADTLALLRWLLALQ